VWLCIYLLITTMLVFSLSCSFKGFSNWALIQGVNRWSRSWLSWLSRFKSVCLHIRFINLPMLVQCNVLSFHCLFFSRIANRCHQYNIGLTKCPIIYLLWTCQPHKCRHSWNIQYSISRIFRLVLRSSNLVFFLSRSGILIVVHLFCY